MSLRVERKRWEDAGDEVEAMLGVLHDSDPEAAQFRRRATCMYGFEDVCFMWPLERFNGVIGSLQDFLLVYWVVYHASCASMYRGNKMLFRY